MSEKLLRKLAALGRSAEVSVFKELVEHHRDEAMQRLLNTAKAEEAFHQQGAVKALDQLIRSIDEAPRSLARSVGSPR